MGQPLVGFTLRALGQQVFPERRALFVRGETVIFREGHLGELYAERGFGKTWVLQTLALVAAAGSEALGFRAPQRCRVLYVDGEMSSQEIQERFALLRERLTIPLTAELTVVAADWQAEYLPRLDTESGQAALEPFIAEADLIVFDNRSCLFDPDGEKDPTAWQPAQDWLLSLRRRGKAVLLAHHSNRHGGARGHSKAEDPMNLLVRLTRPDDYSQDQGARVVVTFEKLRGAHGATVAPFVAALMPDGWRVEPVERTDEDQTIRKLHDYLILILADAANARPKSANSAISAAKVKKSRGLEAWARLLKSGELEQHSDRGFSLVLRETQ